MQELINRLAWAIVSDDATKADRITTHILARVKYPSEPYQIAFQLKSALKIVRRKPHHKIDHDTMWFLKTEEEKLVQCLQSGK